MLTNECQQCWILVKSTKKKDISEITVLLMKEQAALGEIINQDVQKYIRALRQADAPVSAQLV